MNRLLKSAAALLFAVGLPLYASVVTATVTDTDLQPWNGGTFSATLLIPGQPGVVPTVGGVPVSRLKVTGTMSATGVITATLTDTSTVDQKVVWVFTVCANASALPVTVTTTVIGATPNLSPAFSQLAPPRFPAGPNAFGYLDAEVIPTAVKGSTYYNVTLQALRQWNGTAWTGTGGSGGGSNPSTTALAGATIDYNFLDGAGTTVSDISGHSNDATFAAIPPTWNTTGLAFLSTPAQGVALPAAANAGRTFMFGIYLTPLAQDGQNPLNLIPVLLSDNTGATSLNVSLLRSVSAGNFDANNIYSPTIFRANSRLTSSQDLMSGFTVLSLVCGLGGGDKDHLYLGGVEVAAYLTQGSVCATSFAGGLFLGSSAVSPWNSSGFTGTFYRFAVFPTQLTAAVIAKNTATIMADVQSRGVPTTPKDIISLVPQLYGVGDSITKGLGATTPWITLLSLTNQAAYTITNYGISGITTKATIGSEPNRVMPKCKSIAGPNIATVMLGTNDFNSAFGATQAQVIASQIAEIKQLKQAGCMVFAATMISRGGNDSLGVLNDTTKNLFDAALLLNVKLAGADGIIDFAANPVAGADGANANLTYFQADKIHPTNALHVQMSIAASNSLNYYFGSKLSNPNVVTANTYQMLSGDGAVTATPTAAAAYTMPDCTGPSGEAYTISNTSAFVVTIVGLNASQPINGLTAPINIAANSTVTLKDVANPKSVSGCHWAM